MSTEQVVYVENESIFIDGNEYPLITRGRRQAIQMQGLTRWAAKYGGSIYSELQKQGNSDAEAGVEFLANILTLLTADAMIDLFHAITGCTAEEAELYFDAAVLIEAGIVVYEKHPTVRSLIDRFFSTSDSEQDGQPESSTTSE